jgi:hypothetical protein
MPFHLHSNGKVAKLKFCFFPQRCQISNKRIWFKTAYKVVERFYDPWGGKEFKVASTRTYWVDKHEYIIDRLNS